MHLHRRPRTPRAPVWVRRPRAFSIGPFVVAALALVVDAATLPLHPHPVAAALAVVVSAAGLSAARRLPWVAVALVAVAPVVAALLEADPTATWTVGVFVAFVVTTRGSPALGVGVIVAAGNFAAVGIFTKSVSLDHPVASIAAFAAAAAAATGSALRSQRGYWAELDRSTREALASRDAAVRQQVAEERLRIARDLHDTVGHEIAVVSMHLGAAEVQVAADSPARAHLVAARSGVRSLLAETQEILTLLRRDDDDATPSASHARIPDLVAAARAAGVDVEADIDGTDEPLPPQTSAAAFRITQEALTNARRHGAGRVALRIRRDGDTVTIESSNGVPHGRDVGESRSMLEQGGGVGGGHGLIGMRERAAAAGGRLDIEADGGTFAVRAVLPVGVETS